MLWQKCLEGITYLVRILFPGITKIIVGLTKNYLFIDFEIYFGWNKLLHLLLILPMMRWF
jgi:hypothetical protein